MKLKPLFIVTFLMLYCAVSNAQGWRQRVAPRENIPLDSIQLSDPFILADEKTRTYYMTVTGGMLWKSKDLATWSGPYMVIEVDPNSWMGPHPMVWAAEIHQYKDK